MERNRQVAYLIDLEGLSVDEKTNNRATDTATDMELDTSDELLGEKEAPRFSSPVRICFHSIRKRLADYDGLSGKAILDGIVHAGILADDSAKQVKEVSHTQSKGKVEKTIVTIEVITK